jgi:hypothetical protein
MNVDADGATGLLYAPEVAPDDAVRLVVLFHGAGQTPRSVENILGRPARELGFALLLPKSGGPTWDAIGGQPGRDLRALDALLSASADQVAIDAGRRAHGAGPCRGRGRPLADRRSSMLSGSHA